jgi:nucleoside-diphosphate-sugar epimerase
MILITGASGFLGQHLLRLLSIQDRPVRALYHSTPPASSMLHLPGVEWVQCDLLDICAVEEALAGITDVYHCAAIVSFDPSKKEALLHSNVTSTAHVVDAALDAGVRRMIAVSSVASLGRGEKAGAMIDEAADWEESTHNSAYAVSKYFAEMEVWRGVGEGLNALVVNPGIILGAGNWDKGSAKLMKVVDGEFPYYTNGVNSWVDVTDVGRAMIALMASDIAAERFIISAGNYSYKEIFTRMALAIGRKPPHIKPPPFLTALVARWSMLKSSIIGTEPTITPETVRTAQAQCYYDNSKLLKVLPDFEYTPIDDTIRCMAEAYRNGSSENIKTEL